MSVQSPGKERRLKFGLAVFVALTTLLVYLPGLGNDFLNWDDDVNVFSNLHIRSFDWTFLRWAFTDISTGTYWHPIVWISYAVDYSMWGLVPIGYHLSSILLHSLNTFLVVILVIRLLEAGNTSLAPPLSEEMRAGTGLLPGKQFILITACVTGVLFGLHPIHVESVAWISERKDLLCALFFLLSITAYINYVISRRNKEIQGRQSAFILNHQYLLSLIFFILALASKPMAVTLPAVLMILDWYPLRRIQSLRSFGQFLKDKLLFIALSLIVTIITMIAQKAAALLPTMETVPVLSRILVAFWALIMYLWKMVLPLNLLPLYPYPKSVSFWSITYLLPVVLVIVITTACLIAAKKWKVFLACWGYYVISLLPVLGLLQVGHHSMADRFTYLPGLGLFLLAGSGAAQLWSKLESSPRVALVVRSAAIAGIVILCICLSWLTMQQIKVWKDSITFWSYVIEKEPRVPLPYNNRGIAYGKMKQLELALKDFDMAISLEPVSPYTYNNRGRIFMDMGQPDNALEDFNVAITQDASYGTAYNNRGDAYRTTGKTDKALEDYSKAILLMPEYAEAYVGRGIVHGQAGRHKEAIEDFTMAIMANPYYTDAYTARGLSYGQSRQFELAIADLNKAISLNPSSVDAYLNRGVVYEKMGRHERAIEDYDKSIVLSPSDFLLYCNRGIAFREMGRINEAIKDYTKALSLKPDFAQGYVDRGNLYARAGKRQLALKDYQQACYLGSAFGCDAMRRYEGTLGLVPSADEYEMRMLRTEISGERLCYGQLTAGC